MCSGLTHGNEVRAQSANYKACDIRECVCSCECVCIAQVQIDLEGTGKHHICEHDVVVYTLGSKDL